jgi:hypothetical protein
MTKMTLGALFFCTDHIDAPLKKDVKSLLRVFFVMTSVTSYKALELSKKLFDWIEIGRIR